MSTLSRVSRLVVLSAVIAVSAVEAPRGEGTGTIVYVTYRWPTYGWAEPDGLMLMRPDGSNQVQVLSGTAAGQPAWSPDGARIAFTAWGEIMVIPAAGGAAVALTDDPGSDSSAAWSPDGQRIAFISERGGPFELYVMNADGSGVTRVTGDLAGNGRPAWAPDGSRIAFNCMVDSGNEDICTVTPDGASVTRLTAAPGRDSDAAWSPDGSTIAFATQRYGTLFFTGDGEEWLVAEIALMNPDGSGVRQLRAGIAAEYPAWSSDGARLSFDAMEWFEWWMGPLMNVAVVNVDGSGPVTFAARGTSGAWRPGSGNLPPVASFTTSCSGFTCTFNGASSPDPDSSIASYVWDFGDGTAGAGVTATHTYATRGRYSVTLTVSDDRGATASVTMAVELNVRPYAYGQVTCDGVNCNFVGSSSWDPDGTVVAHQWAFGDGATATGPQASHTYSAPGNYLATLTVTDNEGATSTQMMTAFASKPPIASFNPTCNRLTCTFDASASFDPDGSIVSYQWAFGDGTYGSGAIVSHTYPSAGTRGVLLIVNDNLGKQASITRYVTVAPTPPPIASFTSACSHLTCVFDGSSSTAPGGTVTSHEWQFGDGTSSWGSAVSHTYGVPGTYTVALTVRDNFGVPSEQRKNVTVTATPAHVGDLDRQVNAQGSTWTAGAIVTAHGENHTPLANVRVTGEWAHGALSECVTGSDGRCALQLGGLTKQVRSVSVAVRSMSGGAYRPDRNHDPDGDSNGTTIVIKR